MDLDLATILSWAAWLVPIAATIATSIGWRRAALVGRVLVGAIEATEDALAEQKQTGEARSKQAPAGHEVHAVLGAIDPKTPKRKAAALAEQGGPAVSKALARLVERLTEKKEAPKV